MTEHHRRHRRPAAFRLDDDRVTVSPVRASERDIGSAIQVVPEPDSFAVPVPVGASRDLPRRGFRWGALFWGAAGGLVLLAIALGIFDLIKDFFARNAELGWLGLALACLAALSLAVIGIRETRGLMRLANVEHLHQRAADVMATDDRAKCGLLVKDLIGLTHKMPRLARARANLQGHLGDIIDGADLVRLTERELMAPLDQEARALITASVMRVSVVRMACAARSRASEPVCNSVNAWRMPGSTLSIGSCRPMTPVEATSICSGRQPTDSAATAVMRRASARPCGPVQALALPEQMTTPRTSAAGRRS